MPVKASSKPHVVLLTFAAKGHLNPFMSLARQLAQLGVSVTMLVPFKFTLGLVSPASFEGLDIKMEALPIPGDNGASSLPPFSIVMQGVRRPPVAEAVKFPAFDGPLTQALEEMMNDPSRNPPTALVLDGLMPWSAPVADNLGIPRFVFYTAAATHLALGLHLHANSENKSMLALKGEAEEQNGGFIRVPGSPPIRWELIGREHVDENDKFYMGERLTRSFLLGSRGILMNTCSSFEGEVMEGLRERYPETEFLPVGPLIPLKASTFLPSSREILCKSWLDDQEPRSVVYASFGSWTGLSGAQIEELALGLEASKKKFLWVLPVHSQDPERSKEELLDEILPGGFRKRVGNRGLILPDWAPQHLILSHESVGGFVTHCGWNSVMECLVLGGVPMLAWPFVADQPLIERIVVEALKVGVEIHENSEGLAEREEVAAALSSLDNLKLQERARRLKNKVASDREGEKIMEEFVQGLLLLNEV